MLQKMGVLLVLGFASVGVVSCHPKVEVSTVADPVWLEKDEPAPRDGWLVTQGWMTEAIESIE